MGIITVNGLNKYYGGSHILKDFSLEVHDGERVGLLGKNGAGKTTLFKILSGQEGYESGSVYTASGSRIAILDQIPVYPENYRVTDVLNTAFEKQNAVAEEMKRLEIELETNTDAARIKRYGTLQMQFEAMGGYSMESSIDRICAGLEISEKMRKQAFCVLSGGEKSRVNLGRIILQDADILLLDEPTNHLDIKCLEWLEDFLAQYGGTCIAISHDRYFLDKAVKRIVEIVDGKAELYEGNYSYYAREKEARYLQKLAQFEQEQKKIRQLQAAAKRLHEWGRNADNPKFHKAAFSIEKRIERMEKTDKPVKEKQLNSAFTEKRFSGREVAVLEGVRKSYGGRLLLDDVGLTVEKGDRIALIGENGSGKTTLLKLVTGEEPPDSGAIKLGSSVNYCWLQQAVSFENPAFTVLDTVRYALEVSEEKARNRLAAFHFKGQDVLQRVDSLSGGEKSRLRLCLLMNDETNLLILDEPTNHLDIQSREWIEEVVAQFEGTILFVSHDRYFIDKFADRVWELEGGRVTDFDGTYAEYREWKSAFAAPLSKKEQKETKARPEQKKTTRAEDNGKALAFIESRISELEARMRSLEAEIDAAVSNYVALTGLCSEKEKLTEELDRLYGEWEMLQSKA